MSETKQENDDGNGVAAVDKGDVVPAAENGVHQEDDSGPTTSNEDPIPGPVDAVGEGNEEPASPSGLKRPGFSEDADQKQKKLKTDETPPPGPEPVIATEGGEDGKSDGLPPPSTSPLPAHDRHPGQPDAAGAESVPEQSQQQQQQQEDATKEAPLTPNNRPIGGAVAPQQQQPPPQQQQQPPPPHAGGMMMAQQQPQMGYPPMAHQMMGGMMHGQYMQAYAPYPHAGHGYPQSMMMGHQQQHPGSTTPTHQQGGQAPPQPGQPMYYGQPHAGAPVGGDNSQQQPPPMGTPPAAANRQQQQGMPHPQAGAAFSQMPGMMPMQMHMPMMHAYGPPGMFFSQYHMPNMMNPMMAQAAAFNPNNPAAMGMGARAQPPPQAYMTAPPPRSQGTPLSLSCDDEQLSEYQMLVRKQLEVFEAQPEDVESNTQGRKKQVVLGQVGIRCRHCAGFPLRQRGRGAVYYPAKLQGVYQAAQNMASSHLCESCQCIPPLLKQELRTLRDRRDTASGGKQYWADGARAMGLIETEEGLRLRRPEGASAQSPS